LPPGQATQCVEHLGGLGVVARVVLGGAFVRVGRRPVPEGHETAPLPAPPVTTHSAAEMTDRVHARAGCLPRDAVDQAYIATQNGWDVSKFSPFRIEP